MRRQLRGARSYRGGLDAEATAATALTAEGWTVLGQRMRTPAGEIDLVAERDGLLAIIEVKQRTTLTAAAHALSSRQRGRLVRAAEILLATHPAWGRAGVRFDVMLVDVAGVVERIEDAFRLES